MYSVYIHYTCIARKHPCSQVEREEVEAIVHFSLKRKEDQKKKLCLLIGKARYFISSTFLALDCSLWLLRFNVLFLV